MSCGFSTWYDSLSIRDAEQVARNFPLENKTESERERERTRDKLISAFVFCFVAGKVPGNTVKFSSNLSDFQFVPKKGIN